MRMEPGKIQILHLLDGARKAEGLTVIIDVFRAFSVECYLYSLGAGRVRPVGTIEEARELHEKIPGSILVGERQGIRCEGFDYGNSPSSLQEEAVRGRVAIHTTSAGTQGIVNAWGASEILTGSLVNARSIAKYILSRNPEKVSLVAMGLSAERSAAEDELCAEYIRALLLNDDFCRSVQKDLVPNTTTPDATADRNLTDATAGRNLTDAMADRNSAPTAEQVLPGFEARRQDLRNQDGKRFFRPELQEDFPEQDYWMCIDYDQFPFVLRIGHDDLGYYSYKINV